MSVRDIVWHTHYFDPDEPVWEAEGTAYDENDELILVKFTIPREERIKALKGEPQKDYWDREFKDKDLKRFNLNGMMERTRS